MLKRMFRRHAYYIASAAFVLLSFVYFVAIINQAYLGLDLTHVNGKWIVITSDPNGEGYKLGIRVGDQILKINNQDTGEYRFVKKWSEAEGTSSIEFRRAVQPTDISIKIPKRTLLPELLSEIPMIILGYIFWILGLITWYKRPFLSQARALFWLNWFIGLAIVLAPASSRDLMFARELEYITFSSIPIFLIDFFSVFPSENNKLVNRLSRLLLAFISILILILTVLQSVGIIHFNSSLKKLVLSSFFIGILLVLWNLGALVKSLKGIPEKNQTNIILLGMAIGFLPFIILTAIPAIFNFQPIANTEVSYLFIPIFPFTMYYVIVNKYLPDSRRLFRRTIAFILVGIITSVVVTYMLFILKGVKNLNIEVYLASLSSTLLVMVWLYFTRVAISKLLVKYVFYDEGQDLRKRILKLNESLTLISEEERILEEIVKSLSIEGAFFVLENDQVGYFKKAVGSFFENPSVQAELEEFFHADQRNPLEDKIFPDNLPVEIYIPVTSNGYSCGIFLGHRYSRIKFGLDELPLITLILSQLAQRLITTFVIKELTKEIKNSAQRSLDSQRRNQRLQGLYTSLFRSLEKERKLISSEIHDGPLQLGLDLNRWLKYLVDECPTDTRKIKAISHMREVVEDLNFELRLICNDLRPPSLTDLGLLPAIELMCEEVMSKELLLISLETVGINREERFKEEIELAAYRFLQEGIMNVVKHSGSNKLKIHIEMIESRIELTVNDKGKGFDTSKIDDWLLTSVHFGIAGMKERLESLGGDLQISSIIGRGTMLKAAIPIT